MTMLAACAAALACWLVIGPARLSRLREIDARRGPAAVRVRRQWPALAALAAVFTAGAGGGGAAAALALAAALPALTGVQVWRRHRLRAAALANAREVAGACQVLAGLLRVGHVPAAALRIAARDAPVLTEPAALLDIGSEVAPVLRRLGAEPGRSGLEELACAWEVAERTGASLTATLDALAERLAARRDVDNVVAAELSAPRATGRLLAVLPLAGIVLGYGFGGDPLSFLAGSLPGQLSLVVGVALGCAGVLWTEHIAGGSA